MKINIELAELIIRFQFSNRKWRNFFGKKYQAFLVDNDNDKPINCSLKIEPKREVNNFNFSPQLGQEEIVLNCPMNGLERFLELNYFLKLFYAAVLLKKEGFIFHLSAIKKDNFAFLFLGPLGAGKSTISKIFPLSWRLCDDAAIIRKIRGKFWFFSPPLYEKNEIKKRKLRLSIKKAFFIYQSKKNKLQPLAQGEVVGQLVKNMKGVIGLGGKKENWGLLWRLAKKLSRQTEFFNLFFTKDKRLKDFLLQKCLVD